MRVQVISDRTQLCKRVVRQRLQAQTNELADELRKSLADALNSGLLPISTETGALARSLSVQTPTGSDADERTSDAGSLYLTKYPAAHFAERVATEEPLPALAGHPRAAVGTLLAYGKWWEVGSSDGQRQYGPRPWMLWYALNWLEENYEAAYADLLK